MEDAGTFGTLGHCYRCGNTNGPWSLMADGWICDNCLQTLYADNKNGDNKDGRKFKRRKSRNTRNARELQHNFD